MKYFLLLASLLHSITSFSQVQIIGTIVDNETGKPISGLYFYVHKNHDKWINIDKTNEQGQFIGTIRANEMDSSATYQIVVKDDIYERVSKEVDFKNSKPVSIRIIRKKEGSPIDFCSCPSMGSYAPHEVISISELPDSIQQKLSKYLLDRLGKSFYTRTQFAGGNIIDINRLHKVEPNSLDYKWAVQSYYLCFSFIDTVASVSYTGKVALDTNGRVTEELEFPVIAQDASKGNIITKKQAIKIAKHNHFYKEKKTEVSFYYYKKADCFAWKFETCKYNGPNVYCPMWFIAAHTGQVIGKSAKVGLRSFYN